MAQVILSWNVMQGVAVIPKTANVDRLLENLSVFRLSDADFADMEALSRDVEETRFLDPKGYVGFDIFDENADQPIEGL